MKIVIDISDSFMKTLEKFKENGIELGTCETAVLNGTPLPKGHGDLKDMNDLCYKSRYGCKGNCDYLHTCNSYGAPTIIEADKEDNTDGKDNS